MEWDVTADIEAALEEGSKEVSWLLRKADETQPGVVVYYSKEGSVATFGDLSRAPRLLVSFE